MPEILFVSGLNPATRARELGQVFERYGPIERCDIIPPRNIRGSNNPYAFVQFTHHSHAVDALCNLDSTCFEGYRLNISWAKNPPSFGELDSRFPISANHSDRSRSTVPREYTSTSQRGHPHRSSRHYRRPHPSHSYHDDDGSHSYRENNPERHPGYKGDQSSWNASSKRNSSSRRGKDSDRYYRPSQDRYTSSDRQKSWEARTYPARLELVKEDNRRHAHAATDDSLRRSPRQESEHRRKHRRQSHSDHSDDGDTPHKRVKRTPRRSSKSSRSTRNASGRDGVSPGKPIYERRSWDRPQEEKKASSVSPPDALPYPEIPSQIRSSYPPTSSYPPRSPNHPSSACASVSPGRRDPRTPRSPGTPTPMSPRTPTPISGGTRTPSTDYARTPPGLPPGGYDEETEEDRDSKVAEEPEQEDAPAIDVSPLGSAPQTGSREEQSTHLDRPPLKG